MYTSVLVCADETEDVTAGAAADDDDVRKDPSPEDVCTCTLGNTCADTAEPR